MSGESMNARVMADASVTRGAGGKEVATLHGRYEIECVGSDGQVKWRDHADNVVCTEGKNTLLDAALAGSSYTVTGPYIGLISSSSYSTTAATDTQSAHAGWVEAGSANAPTYTGGRKTASWAAASGGAKALSANASFAITGTGTVKGCFMVFGTGAVTAVATATGYGAGSLLSAGLFSGGDKAVGNGDTLNVSYTLSL